MLSDAPLYENLKAFALDDQSAQFKFSDRLARENGWTKSFTAAAIDEYKKFVYLAATSATMVSPSDVVDQVWHQHLTYTRSYWQHMCATLLGKPLHHNPSGGGHDENAKFGNLYAATLAAYRREFGHDAPPAIWPLPDNRARATPESRRIDVRSNLVVAYRTIARTAAVAVGGLASVYGNAAFAAATTPAHTSSKTALFTIGAIIVAIFVFAGGASKRKSKQDKSGSGCSGGSCSTSGHGSDGGSGGHGCGGGGDGGGGCGGGGCGS